MRALEKRPVGQDQIESVSAFADEVERLRHAKDQVIDRDQLSLLSSGGAVDKT